MFDLEIEEERKKKKKEIQQRFMEAAKKNAKKNQNATHEEEKWKEKYEEEKRKRKNLLKQLKKLEKTEEKWKEKQKQWNEKVLQIQKKSIHQSQSNKAKSNEIQNLNAIVRELRKELDDSKFQNQKMKTKLEKQEKVKQKTPEQLLKEIQALRIKVEELKQKNVYLDQMAKINQALKRDEEQSELKKEIRYLRDRNKELKETVHSYREVHTPDNVMHILRDLITEENLAHFFENNKNRLEQLSEKVSRIKQEQKERKKKKVKLSSLLSLINDEKEEDLKIGFIAKTKSTWYFFESSLDDEGEHQVYEVIGNVSNHKFEQDLPVKCMIREDLKATVVKVYEEHELPERIISSSKPKDKEEKKERKEYESIGNAKVLIIGSRNLSEYQQRLMKHGLEVETHNPFEESYHRIEGKCQRADIVVVCTSHISHSVMNHVDKKDPKIELIERDSEEWIVTRIRFALMKHQSNETAQSS